MSEMKGSIRKCMFALGCLKSWIYVYYTRTFLSESSQRAMVQLQVWFFVFFIELNSVRFVCL
jgi:hypothetical protein